MRQLIKILTLLTLTTGTSFSQEYTSKDFVEIKLPKVNSKEWFELNYSRNEIKVSTDNGIIKMTKAGKDQDAILDINDGQLIGTDHGEWGGKIEFLLKGTNDKRLIKEGNVKFIFRFNNEIYFIEGLAHLSTSKGTMYRLDKSNATYSPVKVIEFEDAPEAMSVFGDNIYIACHESFFIVKDLNKEAIFKDTFWISLYPNSLVVIDENNVYLGLRGGYAKLDIAKKNIRFFKYTKKSR